MNDGDIIALAIERQARDRYLVLMANPRKRRKLLDDLNHNPRLDEKRTVWYKSFSKAIEAIKVNPTTPVYIISAASELDKQTMPFAQAVDDVSCCGWGSIILVSPNLALYYGEQGESAAVIQKES